MRTLIIGCGYVGIALGRRLVQEGHEVFGVRRDSTHSAELAAAGINPLRADITRLEDLRGLPGDYDWVVNCVAASGGDPETYRAVYVQGTQNLVTWLASRPFRKFLYTSSTGVYGQNDGSTVTEASPTLPVTETGKFLAEAENILQEAARTSGFPAVILRLAGIYGPGRGYWLKQFLSGEARVEATGARMVNMIHLDDIVGVVVLALERAQPGEIFNVVDNEPTTPRKLFDWLAAMLNRPMPPSVPEQAQNRGKRGLTNKRVDNSKLRHVLGYQFKYPTFREGFAELLRSESADFK